MSTQRQHDTRTSTTHHAEKELAGREQASSQGTDVQMSETTAAPATTDEEYRDLERYYDWLQAIIDDPAATEGERRWAGGRLAQGMMVDPRFEEWCDQVKKERGIQLAPPPARSEVQLPNAGVGLVPPPPCPRKPSDADRVVAELSQLWQAVDRLALAVLRVGGVPAGITSNSNERKGLARLEEIRAAGVTGARAQRADL